MLRYHHIPICPFASSRLCMLCDIFMLASMIHAFSHRPSPSLFVQWWNNRARADSTGVVELPHTIIPTQLFPHNYSMHTTNKHCLYNTLPIISAFWQAGQPWPACHVGPDPPSSSSSPSPPSLSLSFVFVGSGPLSCLRISQQMSLQYINIPL